MERIGWAGWAAASIALALLGTAGVAEARKGDTRTTIFIGQTTYTDGTATTIGTSVGVRWGLGFADDLLWTIGGDYTATEGEHESSEIEARTTTVRTGLLYLFNNEPQSAIVPFVGAGLSVIQYDIDYT
ncbi:MAG: outer membrane beta-barrel protein, partial [bacterium]